MVDLVILSDGEIGYHIYLRTVFGESSWSTNNEEFEVLIDEIHQEEIKIAKNYYDNRKKEC